MSQGSFHPQIRFLGQKVCSVARDRHTDTMLTTEGTLSGFQEFFLQPIIKDRPNIQSLHFMTIFSCIYFFEISFEQMSVFPITGQNTFFCEY